MGTYPIRTAGARDKRNKDDNDKGNKGEGHKDSIPSWLCRYQDFTLVAGGWRDLAAESVSSPLLGEGRRSRGEGGIVISGPSIHVSPPSPAGKAKTWRGKNPAARMGHVPVKQGIASSEKNLG